MIKELHGIILHITNRMVAKFEEQIPAVQTVGRIEEVTQEQEHGLETQLGKRKWTHDPTLLTTSKKLDADVPSTRGERDHNMHVEDG